MTENAFAVHPYLIYAGISFFFLFLLVMLGAILRVSFQVGKIDGRLSGLETAVAELRQDNASIRQEITTSVSRSPKSAECSAPATTASTW